MPRLSAPKQRSWSPAVLAGVLVMLVSAALYLFRLQSLIGPGQGETQTIDALGGNSLTEHLLLLPHTLVASLLLQMPLDDLLAVRLASAILAILSIFLFFLLARRWYGTASGFVASLLFAASGWMLHTGRYGAGYITLTLLVLGLIYLTVWINNTEQSGKALSVAAIVYGLALLVPGGIWFIVISLAISRRSLFKHLKTAGAVGRLTAGGIGLLSLGGLIIILTQDMALVRQWLGLPAAFPGMVDLVKQAALSVSGFLLRGPGTPETWLAHTPLLDAASSALLILGVIFYVRHRRNSRTRLLGAFLVAGALLTALNGSPALGLMLPVVYLVIASGLAYLLQQWRKVFPHNPFAETAALAALGILAVCIVTFHTQRYFTAWRLSPATVEAYDSKSASGNQLPYLIQ